MLLEASHLSFRYGRRKALDDLTFSMPTGATGLLGPNGAGKTTLVRLVMGLLPSPEGALHVEGKDVAHYARELRSRIGLAPEGDILVPRISAVAYVAYAGRISGLPARVAMDRAHMVLHHVGLGAERYRKVEEYSKGMRQRLKLAQALVHDPPFLILDEPTDGMDPQGREEVLELLRDLTSTHGKNILLCTHILDDVQKVCQSVLVISKGKSMGFADIDGTLGEGDLYSISVTGPADQFVDLTRSHGIHGTIDADGEGQVTLGEGDVDRLFERAWQRGICIRRVVPVRESLSQLFTRLVSEEDH
jgi:ABC-2 type transport system ATP-binding protein